MLESLANGPVLAALASGGAAVVALRLAWRRKGAGNRVLVAGGWLALALSTCLWSAAHGVEFGVSYALAWFALCATPAVVLNREYRQPQPDKAAPLTSTAPASTGHKWLTFLAAGPLALLASAPLTLLLTLLLPLARVNQMALAAVLFPTLWALAAYWTSASDRPLRFSLLFVLLGVASYTGLTVMNPSS